MKWRVYVYWPWNPRGSRAEKCERVIVRFIIVAKQNSKFPTCAIATLQYHVTKFEEKPIVHQGRGKEGR